MKTITFKVSDDEARRIRQLAAKERLSVSEFLRRRTRTLTPESGKVRTGRCPVTGATIFAAAPQYPALTTESVKEILSDFP